MEEVQKKRSPWLYVGLGCLGTVVLSCLAGMIMMKVACGSAKQWADDLNNTSKQEQKAIAAANEAIGGTPQGYFPVFSFGIPFVMELIIFLDHRPDADAGVLEFSRRFDFYQLMETDNSSKLRDFFVKGGDASALRTDNFQVQAKEELARGNFMHKDRKVFWVAVRGKMQMQGPYESPQDGLVTTMLFDCPKDGKLRLGVWQMKDDGQTDLKGTVADSAEIEKLLTPLSPCGR
jgi:hypothetical protein